MFPSPGDTVYYNDAGEPLGWDKPCEPEWHGDEEDDGWEDEDDDDQP